jgi:[acyl-carrier-protein] S-malonyltransferase
MVGIGLFFPGQGAQAVGMGRTFFENSEPARTLFKKADEILGFDLSKIIFEGPEGELTQTVNSQPAIYVTSLAALAALKEKYPRLKISSACGLSLGEFSSLAALEVFTFEEGLRLVEKRGRWMEEAAHKTKGSMVSVLGLPLEACRQTAQEAGVEIANINSPEQIVFSGELGRIEKAAKLAEEKGAKRAIILKVSGAFHSSLMKEAGDKLRDLLVPMKFRTPKGLFLSNVTGNFESDPDKIKENLGRQVTQSVQWVETLRHLAARGERYFIELAPGKVLKGLAKKTQPEIQVDTLDTEADLVKILETLKSREEALHASER